MRSTPKVNLWLAAFAFLISTLSAFARDTTTILRISQDRVAYELIGEFNNTGINSQQYGYLSSVAGLSSTFNSTTTLDESTALFTFVTNATTVQTVIHGPFKIVDRIGTTTIYLNNGPSDFSDPATFSQGTPIQVSNYTQQVILNTNTNTFVTVHTNSITSVTTFTLNGVNYRLGDLCKSFRTNYSGAVNTPGATPNGWFAGTSIGMRD